MGIQETVGQGFHIKTPQEFLDANPEIALNMANDLLRFSQYAPDIFGVDSHLYYKMSEHNAIAAVIYGAELIGSMTRDQYLERVGLVFRQMKRMHPSEEQRWLAWRGRMLRDDYGTILLGHEKWIGK